MKSGFTLIELVVSLAIAAMVGTMLTALLSQTATYQGVVERKTSIYTRAAIILHQFEQDIMGACIPIQNSMHKEDEKKGQAQKPPQEVAPQAPTPQGASKKEPVKPVEHVFYVQQAKEAFKLFTCITSNPLQVYWSKQVGKPKPRIARVVYTLASDEQNKNSFLLMRQEDGDLDLKAYTIKENAGIRAYEVIDGVKSVSLQFSVFKYQEEQKKEKDTNAKQSTEPRQRKIENHVTWDWPIEQKESEKKESDKESEKNPLPHFVTLTIELWDELYERSDEFVYTIPVLVDATPEEKEKPQQKPEQAPRDSQQQNSQEEEISLGLITQTINFAPHRSQQRNAWVLRA